MPGKVLRHRGDTRSAMGADEGAGERGDGIGIGPETPVPLHDDVVVGIEAEIDDRTEIEVEAGLGQLLGHRLRRGARRLAGEAKLGLAPTLRAEGK